MTQTQTLLQIDHVTFDRILPRQNVRQLWKAPRLRVLDDVSLQIEAGSSLGLVGESGSGKSTLARLVMALNRPTSGHIRFKGHDLHALSPQALRNLRSDFQMVFQDPNACLNPRQTVLKIVTEPLRVLQPQITSSKLKQKALEMLDLVGLRAIDLDSYPHAFSGGQRQRLAIARALITRPQLIVADEPVSALDVSVQAQVLNLLQDLQEQLKISYLFISHDLAVVQQVCEKVAVLYQGKIVEQGETQHLFAHPQHIYTQTLLRAVL